MGRSPKAPAGATRQWISTAGHTSPRSSPTSRQCSTREAVCALPPPHRQLQVLAPTSRTLASESPAPSEVPSATERRNKITRQSPPVTGARSLEDAGSLAALPTLRAAVREELREFLVGGKLLRELIRDELTLTAKDIVVPGLRQVLESNAANSYGGSLLVTRGLDAEQSGCVDNVSPGGTPPRNQENVDEAEEEEKEWTVVGMFAKVAESWNNKEVRSRTRVSRAQTLSDKPCILRFYHVWNWWATLTEPVRSGTLMRIATGKTLETVVSVTILIDVMMMVYRGDRAIRLPGSTCDFCIYTDWAFQLVYTVELLLKMAAHRLWFFCNSDYKQNWFDLFLVLSGYAGMVNQVDTGGMRVLRILRLGKALRALRVMTWIKHLRVFVVCMQGSLSPFFWAVVMLCALLMIFSLFFVQMVAGYLQDENIALSGEMDDMFGSVSKSMLTLFMATSGGYDWVVAYDVISMTGWMGGCIFLFFIAFVQLSMINIITGIFVDAAMQTLAPDIETMAVQRLEKEQEFAEDLERLCRLVDADASGRLTPEQFEDGMTKGRIPMILMVLGLREDHVLRLFKDMSDQNKDGGGEVDIHLFVQGCLDLKGPSTHFDMQIILNELAQIKAVHAKQFRDIKSQLRVLAPLRSLSARQGALSARQG